MAMTQERTEERGMAKAVRGEVVPASISQTRLDEYRELPERDQRLITAESLHRWTDGLVESDYTLAEVAALERRRQTALRTMRHGAELTDMEFRLVKYLQRHEGRTCTYVQLARHLWATPDHPITARMMANQQGYASPYVACIHVLMGQIRKKLEIDTLRPQHFATVRGVGYRFYSQPPALDDGEDYERRYNESNRQREQLQREFGIIEPDDFTHLGSDGESYQSRIAPGPEFPSSRRGALPVGQNEGRTTPHDEELDTHATHHAGD